jgi:hypothetical protein
VTAAPARGTTRRNPAPPAAFALSGVTVVLRPPIGAADTTPNAGLARNPTAGHPGTTRLQWGIVQARTRSQLRAAACPHFNLRHNGCTSARGLPTRPCIYIITSSSNTKTILDTERLDSGSMHEASSSDMQCMAAAGQAGMCHGHYALCHPPFPIFDVTSSVRLASASTAKKLFVEDAARNQFSSWC